MSKPETDRHMDAIVDALEANEISICEVLEDLATACKRRARATRREGGPVTEGVYWARLGSSLYNLVDEFETRPDELEEGT